MDGYTNGFKVSVEPKIIFQFSANGKRGRIQNIRNEMAPLWHMESAGAQKDWQIGTNAHCASKKGKIEIVKIVTGCDYISHTVHNNKILNWAACSL